MQKLLTILVLFSFVASISARSETACEVDRYEKDLFPTFVKTTVEYTTAKSWKGESVSLSTDIYEPKDDSATQRPLIIVAHGGSFVRGNKEQVAPFCTRFVKKGFVVASIQYRLIPTDHAAEPNAIQRGMIKAVSDMKAAIRFFRNNAAAYKIDPQNIFVGGVSAGAFTALQLGIFDENDKASEILTKIIEEESGSAENGKISTKVRGIFNLSGAILDENWIDKDDPPIFSYHGANDETVAIGTRKGAETSIFGSESIKEKANKVGLDNVFVKVPNGGHVDIYTLQYGLYFLDFEKQVTKKIRSMICGGNQQKN